MKNLFRSLPFMGVLALFACPVRADAPVLPGAGFAAPHYETLWTKSPFAVASAETAPDSPDYSLVGIFRSDGVSYASLIDKQSPGQEHFLLGTDKPARGLTLVSVTPGRNGDDTQAVIQKNGASMTLKLDQTSSGPAVAANGMPGSPAIAMPGIQTPQILMPGSGTTQPTQIRRPPTRFRSPVIHVPPNPGQQQQPSPQQPPPQQPGIQLPPPPQ